MTSVRVVKVAEAGEARVVPPGWERLATLPRDGTFNRWLAAEMEQHGVGQRELATWARVDHSTVSRIVRSEREPSLAMAIALARGLRAARRRREQPLGRRK